MIELTGDQLAILPRWARARVAADVAAIQSLMKEIGELTDGELLSVALTLNGDVFVRPVGGKAVYALEPRTGLLVATADGREELWRGGERIYDMGMP